MCGQPNAEVWASENMLARVLQFRQAFLQFGLQAGGSLLGSLSGACIARRHGLGDMGRPDSPPARGKIRNVPAKPGNVACQNRKCRPPTSNPTLRKHIRTRVFENNALKVQGAATDFGTRRNSCVGRRFPLDLPTLTWRLPLWVIRHS